MIEAMAAGVPCIGADGGGLREIIDNAVDGFLISPGDSVELLERIRMLCDDAAIREKFIANGREKVRRQFTRKRMVQETEVIYYRLVN